MGHGLTETKQLDGRRFNKLTKGVDHRATRTHTTLLPLPGKNIEQNRRSSEVVDNELKPHQADYSSTNISENTAGYGIHLTEYKLCRLRKAYKLSKNI